MMRLKNFTLDPEAMTDVVIHREWSQYQDREELTAEEMMRVICGEDRCSSTHSEDHPEFAALRNQLEELGYIRCQRSWWNGDRVLRSFKINGVIYRSGDRYPSGAAFRFNYERKQKNPDYRGILNSLGI